MRVQLLTQHFVPEITAARYRVEVFVERLIARGHEVEVICAVPNHPQGVIAEEFRGKLAARRRVHGADVRYVWVRTTPTKSARARIAYYGSYAAMATAWGVAGRRPDVVLASSPPLPVGAAAATVAAARRVPWVLDVRDLWPLAAELIGELTNPRLLRLAERLEHRLYRSASRIVTVTRPFVETIRAHVDDPGKVNLIPNGTTRDWLEVGERDVDRAELGLPQDRFIWTYAGNLGPSRRLDVALEAAEQLGDGYQLVLIGDGGSRQRLIEQAQGLSASGQVSIMNLMPADQAALHLRASDALLVPQQPSLGDFVPSKLFDCCAVGRPVIVAADGETLRLATEAEVGIGVAPADAEALAGAVRRLREQPELAAAMSERGRTFARSYLREEHADHLVDLIEGLAPEVARASV